MIGGDTDHPGVFRGLDIKQCDIVIGDSRLLHAAHANNSDGRRTCIILWYFAGFERLPEGVRASIAASVPPIELMSAENR